MKYDIRCGYCGLFCIPFDSDAPFGCSSYEPPEPFDDTYYCKKCSKLREKEFEKRFKNGGRDGYWHKSQSEINAAKKCGLIWIHDRGIGEYNTPEYKSYCYVTKNEFKLKVKLNIKEPIAELSAIEKIEKESK